MERANGAGTETSELGGFAFTQAVDGGNALRSGGNLVGEDGRWRAEGVFWGKQEVCVFLSRVGSEEEVAAGGCENGGSRAVRAKRISGRAIEGAGEHNGTIGACGEMNEDEEGTGQARDGGEGVDNDEASTHSDDGRF